MNFVFPFELGETFIPKGAYRPWDHLRFGGQSKTAGNSQVKLCLSRFCPFPFTFIFFAFARTLCGRPQAPVARRRRWLIIVRAASPTRPADGPGPVAPRWPICGFGGPHPSRPSGWPQAQAVDPGGSRTATWKLSRSFLARAIPSAGGEEEYAGPASAGMIRRVPTSSHADGVDAPTGEGVAVVVESRSAARRTRIVAGERGLFF